MTTTNDTGQLKRRTILKAIGAAGAVGAVVVGTTGSVAAQESCCGSTTLLTDKGQIESVFDPSLNPLARVDSIFSGSFNRSDPDNCSSQIAYAAYNITLSGTSDPCVFDGQQDSIQLPIDVPLSVGDVIVIGDVADASCVITRDQVSVSLCSPNEPPTAVNNSYSTTEDTPLTEPTPGVLGNDSDPDNDQLSASLVSGASNGSVFLNADGSFSYTPNAGFVGTDSFVYEASDGNGGTDQATVTITVTPGGPFLRLPTGFDCSDVDQWTLQIQGNGPIDRGSTICGQSCDEYKVTLKPPKGGPTHKTELCGSDLNNLSGKKFEIEACTVCSTPNYASVTLRPISNKSTK
jgi:hypothetical protein